jgi:hypothetical protein
LNRVRVIFLESLYAPSFISSSRNSAVGVVTGLQIGRLRSRGSVHVRATSLQSIQIGSRSHLTSHSLGTGVLSLGVMRPMREADNSPHLLLRLRMSGAILVPPLPPYAFMACIGAALPVAYVLYFPSFVHVPVFCFLLFSPPRRRRQQQQQQ